MQIRVATTRLGIAALCGLLAGCGSPAPVAYSGLAASSQLAPNPQDDTGRVPYKYSTSVDWRAYSGAILEPVTIYRGPDQQFGDMSDADKSALAGYMHKTFTEKLRTRFTLTNDPGPNTLRIKLTLAGAAANTAVASTFTHLDLAGNLYNGIQAIRGREGLMSGSVAYAVEIRDSSSDRLLSAYVTKQYPNAMNIVASMGSLAAAEVGIEKGADDLLARLK